KSGKTGHTSENFVAIARVARAFPLGHPVSHKSEPVGSDTDACGSTGGKPLGWHGDAQRVETQQGLIGIPDRSHQVTCSFICREVIIKTLQGGLTDTGFLGSVTPVAHIVAG